MRLVHEFLSVAFSQVLPEKVLKDEWSYQDIPADEFVKLMTGYLKRYSGTELKNIYDYLKEFLHSDYLNVFHLLFAEANRMLTIQDNQICCRYEKLMRWRMMTFALGEELFTTSFIASHDEEGLRDCLGFSWRFVIGHDNYHLNKLLREGLCENHFHLGGSAPVFPLTWIAVMNDPFDAGIRSALQQIDQKKRYYHISYLYNYKEESVLQECETAALIRVFLYAWLTDQEIWIGDYHSVSEQEYRLELNDGSRLSGEQSMSSLRSEMSEEAFRRVQKKRTEKNVMELLRDRSKAADFNYEMHQSINHLKKHGAADYALEALDEKERYLFYAGERWLMFEMFRRIYRSSDKEYQPVFNLFYAYLLLKNRLHEELVQSNDLVGFDNFQIYQGRKKIYRNQYLSRESIRQAMHDCTVSNQLKSLEARIAPFEKVEKYAECIRNFDTLIDPEGKNQERFFYVFHFLKRPDTERSESIYFRHQKFRKLVERQSKALAGFRENYPKLAARVHGIDAASQEIGCRPEVFATAFRFLQSHIVRNTEGLPNVPQLRQTYHVGEDFLDIADGLRAIEEAVRFLNLRSGDRIGHALALGMDVNTWYSRKKYYLVLPIQDYLDNLVWIYEKLTEMNLWESDGLKVWIEEEFETHFREIYKQSMQDDVLRTILDNYKRANAENSYSIQFYSTPTQLNFGIHTYYQSWQLRGDHPALYEQGFYIPPDSLGDAYERKMVNDYFPENGKLRYILEVNVICYMYHYCHRVKKEGRKIFKFKVDRRYARAVEKIQREMQRWIGKKGIAIETNPSSNFRISSMERYEEHPIRIFYNKGLTSDEDALKKCPQLNVSINTDDQGVFSTSLPNEYSLMAYALEHWCDDRGQQVYSREMVLEWLENIKRMGDRQTFN